MSHADDSVQITPKILELFVKALSEFLVPWLFGLRDPQIRLPCFLPIGAGFLRRDGSPSVHVVDEPLGFLSSFSEKMDVRGKLVVSGHADGIDAELALPGRGRAGSLLFS